MREISTKKVILAVFGGTFLYELIALIINRRFSILLGLKRIYCAMYGHTPSVNDSPTAISIIKRNGILMALAVFPCTRCGCMEQDIVPLNICTVPARLAKILEQEENEQISTGAN